MKFRYCAAALVAAHLAGGVSGAAAQEVLPEIVVSAPSPIAQRTGAQNAPAWNPGTLPVLEYVFAPITVVTQDEIRRSPASTIGDMLSTYPGVSATGFVPNIASRPIIRGLDNYRVRVQENGIGAMDVSAFGEDHAVPINPLVANQIEVIRGPATLRYGSGAIGGVVEVDTDRIISSPFRGINVDVRGSLSSVDQGAQGATVLRAGNGQYAVFFDAFGRSANDYNTPLGRQLNTFQRSNGQSIGASTFGQNGYAGFNVAYTESLYGIPGEGAAENTRIAMQQLKFSSQGEYRPDNGTFDAIRFWFGAADYKHDEIHDDPTPEIGSTFKNREQEARIEFQLTPWKTAIGPMQSAVGFHFNNQNLSTAGEAGSLLAPAQTTSFASYVFNEIQLDPLWRFQTAARIEGVRVDGTGANAPAGYVGPPDLALFGSTRNFVPVSVSAGLLRDLPWQTVGRFTAQYVERAPKAAELFSKGPHEATGTFEIGDPNLNKEAATSFEFGLRRAKGALRFDASVFHTRYNGFIYKRFTGNQCDDDFLTCGNGGTELEQIVYSQQNANFSGFEAVAQLDVMPLAGGTFGIDGQYDIVRARFSDGTNVPRIPPQRVGAGLFWRDGNWLARTFLLHAFDQDRVSANETATKGYNLLKAEISYTKTLQGTGGPREITIGLVGNNLLNDDIRNHVAFNKDEVLAPGRDIRLFVNTRF
ncbi:MAG: TonB-dependent receptor [Xanthobacteraceae bacterium]|nr:TonB-dependent receptor [Xanthobacteraceae bacterium]